MAKYKIGVWWMESGSVEVEADTADEAVEKAQNANINLSEVEHFGYVDDSYRVDENDVEEL